MTAEEYTIEWWTQEELNKVQENLSAEDFDVFLRQLRAFHGLQIGDVIQDEDDLIGNID